MEPTLRDGTYFKRLKFRDFIEKRQICTLKKWGVMCWRKNRPCGNTARSTQLFCKKKCYFFTQKCYFFTKKCYFLQKCYFIKTTKLRFDIPRTVKVKNNTYIVIELWKKNIFRFIMILILGL